MATQTGYRLTHERIATPFGAMTLVSDAEGELRALALPGREDGMRRSLNRHYGSDRSEEGRVPAEISGALSDYFDGDLQALRRIRWKTGGTEFQRRVWNALWEIPVGETTSYGALAVKLGNPGAMRAVGMANGANPIAIVVPCHRVIGSDGSLTGFGGGLPLKVKLLRHEGANVPALGTSDLFG